ncbi:MAG: hypothetical protein Q9159_002869 [Coniocarpon cinnabarinum]
MADSRLPSSSDLSNASPHQLHSITSILFEDSPELESIITTIIHEDPPSGYESLIELVRGRLKSFVPTPASLHDLGSVEKGHRPDSILNAHPRLGENKVNLSASSAAEQSNLQSSTDQQQALELAHLNAEYEAQFEGLHYLVFVNGRGRPEIFQDMRRRMARANPFLERVEAIDALCDIALDRVQKMVRKDRQ